MKNWVIKMWALKGAHFRYHVKAATSEAAIEIAKKRFSRATDQIPASWFINEIEEKDEL
jgi:hypothetical protein